MKPIDPRKGIVVSYPHSGLNWVRYCIESLTGLRTPGTTRIVQYGELAVYRTHNVKRHCGPNTVACSFYDDAGQPIHQRVVLLLRDYRESFLRVAKSKPSYDISAENIENGRVFNFRNYFDNLDAYDKFESKKLLVRYEELVSDVERIRLILDFLDLPPDIRNFDVEAHRRNSLQLFDGQHLSFTKSDLLNFSWHRDGASDEVMTALDSFVMSEYPVLMRRYFPAEHGRVCSGHL